MIPHALFRNLIVPLFMSIYLIDETTELDFDQFFKWFSLLTLLAIPGYLGFLLLGVNPFSLIVYPSWTSWISPMQYLVYTSLLSRVLYDRTDDSSFSYCLAVVSASVVGYLYEVPRWLIMDGFWGLFRTARNSLLVLDFGMLAVPFLFFMLRDRKPVLSKGLLISGVGYLLYVMFYAQIVGYYIHTVYPLVGLPTTVLCRVPAMWLVYHLVTTKSRNK